jgi:hypothetical protein
MRNTQLVLSVVLLASTGLGRALADDAAEIRKLIPFASAMKLADLDRLAMSPTSPKESDVEDKSLTLMFLTFPMTTDEKAREQFRFLVTTVPKPSDLVRELYRNVVGKGRFRVALGPVTFIQADRITDFTCEIDGERAAGTVSFEVPELYEGKADYVARRTDGKWQIAEFMMPGRGVHIVRGEKGKWRRKAQADSEK